VLDLASQNLFHCNNFPNFPNTRPEVAVNKGELVDAIAQRSDLDKRQAESALNAFVNAVTVAVKGGDKVAILGFGTFSPTSRTARIGRNPQTGAPVKIAASKSVRFAPGAAFKSALNKRGAGKKAAPAKKAASAKKAVAKKSAKTTTKKK
jgi:DNA-binding protein HU-beta